MENETQEKGFDFKALTPSIKNWIRVNATSKHLVNIEFGKSEFNEKYFYINLIYTYDFIETANWFTNKKPKTIFIYSSRIAVIGLNNNIHVIQFKKI